MELLEKTGEKFNLATYFKARLLCQEVVANIAAQVVIGMNEAEGQKLIKEEFKKVGVHKFWHPSKFRIGAETTKNFGELPDNTVVMTPDEIFFIDVGPIIEGHEADYGQTFVFEAERSTNHDLMALSLASEKVWRQTAQAWKDERLTGQALYDRANEYSQRLGYKLNPEMAGHRLGDFPHALFSKEDLSALKTTPSSNLWVLEIHILSERENRGAFFEDILLN